MKEKIKLKLSYYMLIDLLQYVDDAVYESHEMHTAKRDRNKMMVLALLISIHRKINMKLVDYKKQYNLSLSMAEACALHEYYNKMVEPAFLTNVTIIIGEIDKQTA